MLFASDAGAPGKIKNALILLCQKLRESQYYQRFMVNHTA
jgi:hypothetical protein